MNTPSNQETGKWKQRAQKPIYSGPRSLSGERAVLSFTEGRSPGDWLEYKLVITVKEGRMARLIAAKGTMLCSIRWLSLKEENEEKEQILRNSNYANGRECTFVYTLAKKQCPGLVLSG